LRRHPDRHSAMAVALRRSRSALVASAATVVVGLLCLFAADLNSSRSLAGVGAVGIAAGFLAMTTLLPALLLLAGRWVFWPLVPRVSSTARQPRLWPAVASTVGRRPRLVWTTTAAALALLAVIGAMSRIGLTDDQEFTSAPGSVVGQRVLAEHFPAGASAPAFVVADASAPVTTALRGTRGVAAIGAPRLSTDGELALYEVTLSDPPDSRAAERTVGRLRDAVATVPSAAVGGPTAQRVDTHATSDRDLLVVVPLVLVVILLILAGLLRAVVMPVLLVASVVLSYLAALGATSLILEGVWDRGAYNLAVPLLGFVVLVALGVDYNIFLMARVREETAAHGHQLGVLRGLSATGGVITSAGVVLAATFGILAGLPLMFMVQLGVLVAVGVLIDTVVVRSLLVPALTLDIGPVSWWPGRPARPGRVASAGRREPSPARAG
jgi:putative drug exporter of the RND superfamily